ncbi:holin [Brochothrix thermosphacta]|uniref:Holin n=1 Tax=Brochothrix thermosphacta TaxID=2756 RepID=A0A291BUZ2_BROTH|nr:phage holin family protein [Brochothrix thermosphacta]ATF25038.1 holin [Brochothrix thermosphacta]
MEQINIYFQGVNHFLFGEARFLHLLIYVIAIDIVLGMLKGIKLHSFKSSYSIEGFTKKFGMIVLVMIANIMAQIMPEMTWIVAGTIVFLIANEIGSIVENLSLLGVPIPDFITDKLAVLRNSKVDKDGRIKK